MNTIIRYTRPKNIDLKKKHKLTKKITYEFVEELWNLIKEYAVPKVFEPIKIGEHFLYYKTYEEEFKGELCSVDLCVRVEDKVISLEKQKEFSVPITYNAQFITLQTLKMKGVANPKPVISRIKKELGVAERSTRMLFSVRRSVVGAEHKTLYWDKPDEKHHDDLFSRYPINKTRDPTQPIQFIKTKATKLTRDMFPEFNL